MREEGGGGATGGKHVKVMRKRVCRDKGRSMRSGSTGKSRRSALMRGGHGDVIEQRCCVGTLEEGKGTGNIFRSVWDN